MAIRNFFKMAAGRHLGFGSTGWHSFGTIRSFTALQTRERPIQGMGPMSDMLA